MLANALPDCLSPKQSEVSAVSSKPEYIADGVVRCASNVRYKLGRLLFAGGANLTATFSLAFNQNPLIQDPRAREIMIMLLAVSGTRAISEIMYGLRFSIDQWNNHCLQVIEGWGPDALRELLQEKLCSVPDARPLLRETAEKHGIPFENIYPESGPWNSD